MNVNRWGTLIYIMVYLTISVDLQAQDNHVLPPKQVRITNTLFSIDSLSRLITAQTGLFLSFNSNKVAAGKKIATEKRLYAVGELLELIKSNTGSSYKIYKDHVIFHGGDKQDKQPSTTAKKIAKQEQSSSRPIPPNATASNKSAAKETPTASNKREIKETVNNKTETQETPALSSKSGSKDPLSNKTETQGTSTRSNKTETKATPIPTQRFILEPIKPNTPKPPITLMQKPSFAPQRPPASPQIPQARWFADGGFTIDDVLYLNPSITAGHKYLHGFFSWSSSFKVSGFRYGLGSMIPLNDEWRIGLLVTTGKLNRDIDFTGVRDTLKNITVKSELHRVAIQVEKSIKPYLVVKAGPVFNLLKSSYYQDGQPVTVATSGYEGTNADRELYTVKPLYTLSNSYKETTPDNTKTWIGFQVSLCYRFNF